MLINTKTTFAFLVLTAGLLGAAQVHAGERSLVLGDAAFADRCYDNGGDLLGLGDSYGCDLGTILVECSFAGAYADCEWDGAQNKREVIRLIGMADPESLASDSGFAAAKKKGGVNQLDLPLQNK
jgi:hypothetical protein